MGAIPRYGLHHVSTEEVQWAVWRRRAAYAGLVAWLLVGAVTSTIGRFRPATPAVHTLGFLINVAQHLAAGLVALGLVLAWRRMPASVQRFWFLAYLALTLVGAWIFLREDLSNLGENLSGALGTALRFGALLVAASMIPIGSLVTRRLAHRAVAWPLVMAALLLAGSNALVLPRLYAGAHLWVAWASATVIGDVLVARAESRARRGGTVSRRALRAEFVVLAVLAVLAVTALVMRPTARVQVALLAEPGAVFAPFAMRARAGTQKDASVIFQSGEWFVRRTGAPIVATRPAILPNDAIVLLLTLDAFRADTLGNAENSAQFPTLSRLRDQGVYFTEARAPASQTAASIAAIFSGRFYSQLRWAQHPRVATPAKTFAHEDVRPRFPELLRDSRVHTFTSTSSDTLLNEFGLARGFEEEKRQNRSASTHARAIIERLERAQPGERLFITAHFMEPHEPYVSGGSSGTPFQRYLREVAVVDREIARILDVIEKKGWTRRTTLIITGDHGEAFGEHNTQFHGTTLYEELLHVPLIIFVPGMKPRRFDELVTLADVGPTVLDLMGLDTPASFLGQSLTPVVLGKPVRLTRPVVAESGRGQRALYFPDKKKVIVDSRTGTTELYDLSRDPGELDNVYDSDRDVSRVGELNAYFQGNEYRAAGYTTPYRP